MLAKPEDSNQDVTVSVSSATSSSHSFMNAKVSVVQSRIADRRKPRSMSLPAQELLPAIAQGLEHSGENKQQSDIKVRP